jgi:predicted  nucleic acid-binding Zn-ribbon protein
MQGKLPDHIRSLVIKQWLEGMQRDLIAANNGLSAGGVTNIVNDFRRGLGSAVVDDLRELGVTFRKVGITPAQCALGFRVAMMIVAKLGVKEEELESFILDVYNRCIDLGLSPDNIALHIKDLTEFSKTNGTNNNHILPLSQISEFIQQKADEKKKLEEEIQTLKSQIKILDEEKSKSEHRRAYALYEEHFTNGELKSYSDLKQELGRYGVPIYDIPKFAKVVRGISQKDYNVEEVIEEFSDIESARNNYSHYKASITDLQMKCNDLKQEYSVLKQSVVLFEQKLSLYHELEAAGFDLEKLKLLSNTIKDIANANNIPESQAVQKFYKDIEEQYDDKLGFESQLNKLRSEIATVSINLNFSRRALLDQPLVGPSLQRLFSKGVVEQDIVELANLFERSYSHGGSSAESGDSNSGTNGTNIDRQSLIRGLQKYGGIKTIIQELNQQIDELNHQISELQTKKKDLDEQNQKMLSILAYSKPIVEFLNRSDNDYSVSSDKDNVKIFAMIAYTLFMLYIRHLGIGKLLVGELNELVHVQRMAAAAAQGEAVSIPELKIAIVKALEILMTKSDTESQTSNEGNVKDMP